MQCTVCEFTKTLRLKESHISSFNITLQRRASQHFYSFSCLLFHNKLDISLQECWDSSRVLLICSHLAVSQLAHYGGRLLMKLKAGCGDNYSYRQISCCSESITMSFGYDGDFLQIFLMTNNEVINMAAVCYQQ